MVDLTLHAVWSPNMLVLLCLSTLFTGFEGMIKTTKYDETRTTKYDKTSATNRYDKQARRSTTNADFHSVQLDNLLTKMLKSKHCFLFKILSVTRHNFSFGYFFQSEFQLENVRTIFGFNRGSLDRSGPSLFLV